MGAIAILLAVGAAGWLLYDVIRKRGARRDFAFRLTAWLALSGVAFAAKLWPIAFLLLLGAGGVAGIEWLKEKKFGAPSEGPKPGAAPAPTSHHMTAERARAVLGVSAEAGADEVRAAHRRLIARLHPDGGGSDYLAAEINQARDALIKAIEAASDKA